MNFTYLNDLNPPQKEAVTHFRGPILVLAGAGSGKTRVLTHRVVNLVLAHNIRPSSIIAVTFTNKAADEMKSRLVGLLGESAKQLWVSTFHSAALRMLRRHATQLGYSDDFVVYDDDDSRALMKGVLKELGLSDKKNPPQLFLRVIDRAKNNFITAERFLDQSKGQAFNDMIATQAEVYDRYQKALMRSNAMDFGDLLVNAVRLFKEFPDILALYQRHLEFVLVDEFQDTNIVQYMWLRLLTATHHNLLVVGDDDQSIYAFRGATIKNILDFERDYPDTKVVKLEQNYRSSANILDSAHAVIEKNRARKPKKLWTASHKGAPVFVFEAADEMEEAAFVSRKISEHKAQGLRLSEVAVFYRTNAQSRALEEELMSANIPYRIYGGLRFYDRKEIKDILAYLRLLVNPQDSQAFVRTINTPPRGIGPQTLQLVVNAARAANCPLLEAAEKLGTKHRAVHEYCELISKFRESASKIYLGQLIEEIIELSDYGPKLKALKQDVTAEARLENLMELIALGRSHEHKEETHIDTLRAFLDRISLTAGNELPVEENRERATENKASENGVASKPEVVSLMTLHLAKGLEFPVVFLTGMEEGLLPHYKSLDDPKGVEEERRLCYVGITRAMRNLYLTRAEDRGMFSAGDGFGFSGFYRKASRFLLDIPSSCVEYAGYEAGAGSDDDNDDEDDDADVSLA